MQAHRDELVDELVVNRDLHHGCQHDRTDPQRQNRVERRHGRTVVADRIDRLAIERNGAGKRHGQPLGIIADHRLDRRQVARHQGAVELVLEGTDLFRRLTQLIGSLVDQLCGLGEALCQRTGRVGQTVYGTIKVARDAVERVQNARNRLLELLGLNRERGIVVGLAPEMLALASAMAWSTSARVLLASAMLSERDFAVAVRSLALLRYSTAILPSDVATDLRPSFSFSSLTWSAKLRSWSAVASISSARVLSAAAASLSCETVR